MLLRDGDIANLKFRDQFKEHGSPRRQKPLRLRLIAGAAADQAIGQVAAFQHPIQKAGFPDARLPLQQHAAAARRPPFAVAQLQQPPQRGVLAEQQALGVVRGFVCRGVPLAQDPVVQLRRLRERRDAEFIRQRFAKRLVQLDRLAELALHAVDPHQQHDAVLLRRVGLQVAQAAPLGGFQLAACQCVLRRGGQTVEIPGLQLPAFFLNPAFKDVRRGNAQTLQQLSAIEADVAGAQKLQHVAQNSDLRGKRQRRSLLLIKRVPAQSLADGVDRMAEILQSCFRRGVRPQELRKPDTGRRALENDIVEHGVRFFVGQHDLPAIGQDARCTEELYVQLHGSHPRTGFAGICLHCTLWIPSMQQEKGPLSEKSDPFSGEKERFWMNRFFCPTPASFPRRRHSPCSNS